MSLLRVDVRLNDAACKRDWYNVIGIQCDVSNLAGLIVLPRSSRNEVADMIFANTGVGQPIARIVTEEHFDNIQYRSLLFTVRGCRA